MRPLLRLLTAIAVLAGAQLGLGVLAPAAQAAERTITITADGPEPVTLTGVRPGDTIVFVNGDGTFPHTVASRSANWSFSTTIFPGDRFEVPDALTTAGRYLYGDDSELEDYSGEVVVGTVAKPSRTPTRSPAPRATRSAPATSEPTASPTSGTGVLTAPPIAGGPTPSATPTPTGPAPVTAPEPSETEDPEEQTTVLGDGPLPEPYTPRAYGLPGAVAAVGAVGTATLLVRFLLAHPAGRASARVRREPLAVTVEEPGSA